MPKKILNLNEKIFEAALNLFGEEGYDNVDMKAIAKKCNIAVGTLYNYYDNKKDLFLKVLEESWTSTFNKINEAIDSIKDKEKCTFKVIEILYMDIKARRGIGKYLIENNSISKEESDKIQNNILDNISNILLNTYTISDGKNIEYKARKLINIILCNAVILAKLYPEDDDANIIFLNKILKDNLI